MPPHQEVRGTELEVCVWLLKLTFATLLQKADLYRSVIAYIHIFALLLRIPTVCLLTSTELN